ncbi:hypothetical protein BH23GEM6_BH23GEM6_12300 [soil metagenome]
MDGTPVAKLTNEHQPRNFVHSIVLKLEADVHARKRRRIEYWPTARLALLVLVLGLATFELGARSVDSGAGWSERAATRARLSAFSVQVEA